MKAERYDIRSYAFDPSVSYFVDTNVWFRAFGPFSRDDWRARVYKDGVERLRASGAKTFVDAIVMSEFANVRARLAFHSAGEADFKMFRRSGAFKVVARDIAESLREILRFAMPVGTAFANIDVASLVAAFETGEHDFNDLLIVETCRSKSFMLVTDDGDMKDSDVPIVTGNQSLLK